MLQMPPTSVDVHQLMGKMVMSDMFDQDELDQVKAALELKAQVDLKKQRQAMKLKLQREAAAKKAGLLKSRGLPSLDEAAFFSARRRHGDFSGRDGRESGCCKA